MTTTRKSPSGPARFVDAQSLQFTKTGISAPAFAEVTLSVADAQVGDMAFASQTSPDPTNSGWGVVGARRVTVAGQVRVQIFSQSVANVSGAVDLLIYRP